MMKIALPILLAGIIMIAGIFAFMPIDKATTVHTTIQGTQLNNVASTFDTDLSSNATAGCGSAGGSFLVHYTFTNGTEALDDGSGAGGLAKIRIDDGSGNAITINLALENQTSISGVVGGTTGETMTFTDGFTKGNKAGEVSLTVVCQSGSTPALIPAP